MKRRGLVSFNVRHKETDLFIQAKTSLKDLVSLWVIEERSKLEAYAGNHPGFLEALTPWKEDEFAPFIVKEMIRASKKAGVGPMAAVAGTIAEIVAKKIYEHIGGEVIVENGGDIVLRVEDEITMSIWAGDSPFSGKIGIRLLPQGNFLAVCTSSGTIGHSKSLGASDAVTVISKSGAYSDALATSIGNIVRTKADVQSALNRLRDFPGVLGGVIIKADAIGAFGELELVTL